MPVNCQNFRINGVSEGTTMVLTQRFEKIMKKNNRTMIKKRGSHLNKPLVTNIFELIYS